MEEHDETRLRLRKRAVRVWLLEPLSICQEEVELQASASMLPHQLVSE